MSLSIHTNASAKTAINSLSNAGLSNAKSSQRLSTGFRINSPADNAAGLQITNRMEKFLNSAGQAKQNIQESIAMLQIADGGLAESVKTLNAMKKLATQAANDTNSAADREAIQKEFSELGKELQNALNNTEYNSEKLFADGGKMRKELNFQSGTDAESSLKLDLNSVIAELTESVTKKATPVKADVAGSTLEKEADVWIRQQRQLRKQKRLLKASKRRWKQILQLLVIKHRQKLRSLNIRMRWVRPSQRW